MCYKAFSVLSPIPLRFLPEWYWVVLLSSHLHYTSKKIFLREEKSPHPLYVLMHVEKRLVQRDCETVKTYRTRNLPWKAKPSPSRSTLLPL